MFSILLGVLKAVGHINDTLGPALIASVSARLVGFGETDGLERAFSRTACQKIMQTHRNTYEAEINQMYLDT